MNEIVTQQNFQEKIINRLRKDIGELIGDEELKMIVEKAMNEIFFKQIETHIGFSREIKPSWIHNIVKELLRDKVYREVVNYVSEHNEEVLQTIKEVITQGMGKALVEALTLQFQNQLMTFQNNIINQIQNR